MLIHIHFLASRFWKGRCAGGQQQRLAFPDSVTRTVTALAAIPRMAKFATACTGIL